MPHIVKIGRNNVCCWKKHEIDRIPNVALGKNARINTNNVLKNDKKLSEFVNDKTMGALDNYAAHENMNIYITPLENDLFDDLAVSVYKKNCDITEELKFPVKLPEGKKAVAEFLTGIYTKIDEKFHPKTPSQFLKEPVYKPSKVQDAVDYVKTVAQRIDDKRIETIRNFVEKNQNTGGFSGMMADILEFRFYNRLYK